MDRPRSCMLSSSMVSGALLLSFLLCGCGGQKQGAGTPAPPLVKHGVVQGGAQPVSNSTIQLYAVGTAGDGSPATALLSQAVSTDANGEFDITGSYSCPSSASLVYVVAIGGNPGLAAGTNNTELTLMAALGACGSITTSTPIHVNELTTVAAVWALAPYISSYSSIGSGSADATAMADAFTLASYYANTSTGTVPGLNVPAGMTVPVAQLDTLADILASCVDTAGGVVGDGSTCGTLFAAATPVGETAPVNVIGAGKNIANNPTANIAGLFALVAATAPYQPTLEGMPASLALGLSPTSGLSLSSSALTFPSTTVGVASAPMTVTVRNTGAAAITLSGASFSGAAVSDFSVAAGCPATLAAGASCAVQVVFTPSVAGTRSASLSIPSNAANSPLTVSLTGTGVAGGGTTPPSLSLSVSPSALTFPSGTVGVASTPLSVTVTNTGAAAITLSGASFSGAAASDFSVAAGCPATLAVGASCAVQVVFIPSAAGTRSASLSIPSNAANSPLTVSLTGTGVAGGGSSGPPPPTLYGHVEGGVQPVSNSAIQMYAVGTTADGSAATALLTQPVSTDVNGGFNIAGDYTCPSATSLVYVVAIGGNPGLAAGTNNTALTMMAALGACGNLTASTPIYVNELTTVAAVWSLAPYMSSYSSIGSSAGDAAALANAFTLASYYANPSTGTVPGLNVSAGTTVPVAEINTLADILATCVDSPGGAVGDGSACGTLFAATMPVGGTAPGNVISAGLNIADNPTANISSLYALVLPSAPFQPVLTAAPADWTVGLASSSPTSALSVEPSALSFPNIAVGETSAPVSVTVTNIGTSAIAMYGASTIGSDAANFVQSTDCPGTLNPSTTCTVQVTFTPLAVGARDASVSVVSGAPNSPQMVALSGTGVAGSAGPVTITPSALTFYTPGVAQLLTLTNYGATPLSIGAIVFSSPNWTQVNNCGALLDAQSVCTIAVTAGSTAGQFSGTLSMIDNDTTDAQTVSVTSKILNSLGVDQFPPAVIGASPSFNLPIEHTGGVPEGSGAGYYFWSYGGSFSGANPGDFSATICNVKTMEPGPDVCSVSLNFQPTATGLRTAYFTDYLNQSYYEEGFGIGSTPSFDISTVVNAFLPAVALDFGNHAVGSSTTLSLTVTNTSLVSLSFETPTLSGGASNNGDFQLLSPGCGLLQGFSGIGIQSCNLQIVFLPTVLGARSAMLTLTESSGISKQVLITGQGTYAAPIITPARLQFGNVQIGAVSTPQTVTVVLPNQDAATAHLENNPSSYHLSQNASCARGASVCQFTLVFSPLATGETDDALLVTDLVTGYYSYISLTGSGGIPTASLSSTMLTYSSRSVGVTSIPQTITLTNNGNVPLVLSAVGLGGSNASDFSIVSNTCGANVAPAASCAVSISFTPSAAGTRSASLLIQNNSANSPLVVPLTGTGVASDGTPLPSSSLSVSPSALTFPSGTVGGGGFNTAVGYGYKYWCGWDHSEWG